MNGLPYNGASLIDFSQLFNFQIYLWQSCGNLLSSNMFGAQYVTNCFNDMVFCRKPSLILMHTILIIKTVSAVDYSMLDINDGWFGNMGLTEVPICNLGGRLD